jgi:23S rRNA (uracil1939-C5)-methyltransferase
MRPNAFLQTNTAMAERLYGLAREHAQLTGEESVYDLYCGIGTIGLALAADALTVWGVEVSEESVACALENAELKGISNAAFFAGEVGDVLDDLRDRAGDPDVVVVDPPRAGLSGKTLRRLAKIEAKRIVYVSCNPTTLGREREGARRRVGVQARARAAGRHVPHTPHIETVALLSKA